MEMRRCGLCGYLGSPDSFSLFFERSAKHLLRLDFSENPHLIGELKQFAKLTCLEELVLDGCSSVTVEVGALLLLGSGLSKLTKLYLARCVSNKGDLGSLAHSGTLTGLDVCRCPLVTEPPQSWLLRFLKPRVAKNKRVRKEWAPWGSPDWRT